MSFETISVIGLGYIGLPTAAMFASKKKKVIGVDVNKLVVETINRGEIHIVEPQLCGLVNKAVGEGFLRATNTTEEADAFLIAVPTPFMNNNSEIPEPDLRFIKEASDTIASVLKKGDLVILESTSPVGATEKLAEWLSQKRPDLTFPQDKGEHADINIAHCPERVLPGQVVRELVENDRVIGGMSTACSYRAIELYKTFVEGECVVTNARTAEMAKLTENSSRDVQIAFANELSIICDKEGIDVWELISLANRHPRVNILNPGPGVGGHCIAVDPWFIVSKTPKEAKIIHTARMVNDHKPNWVINKIKSAINNYLQSNPKKSAKDIVITCYGLTFKPDIDDLRESPAVRIAEELVGFHEGEIFFVEPNVNKEYFLNRKIITFDEASKSTDIHVILQSHTEFEQKSIEKGFVLNTTSLWLNK